MGNVCGCACVCRSRASEIHRPLPTALHPARKALIPPPSATLPHPPTPTPSPPISHPDHPPGGLATASAAHHPATHRPHAGAKDYAVHSPFPPFVGAGALLAIVGALRRRGEWLQHNRRQQTNVGAATRRGRAPYETRARQVETRPTAGELLIT